MKKPCPECPFSRLVEPGALGGSPPDVYIGQASLPFWLPCHCSANYAGKQSDVNAVAECHGAAIFRANIGVDAFMPDALLHLPANHEDVFSTIEEFYAHHVGLEIEAAKEILTEDSLNQILERTWTDRDVKMRLKAHGR